MGIACNTGASEAPTAPELPNFQRQAEIELYGDYFDSDTRSLLIISETAGVDINFILVDRFRKDHIKAGYTDINPLQSIPMLKVGNMKVIGPGMQLFMYFLEQNFVAKRTFYP